MNRQKALLLLTVFAANFPSLVLQAIWTRKLSVVFGSTAFSVSAVPTVFLSGVALGGYLGGAGRTNTDNLPYLEFSTVRNLLEFPRMKRP